MHATRLVTEHHPWPAGSPLDGILRSVPSVPGCLAELIEGAPAVRCGASSYFPFLPEIARDGPRFRTVAYVPNCACLGTVGPKRSFAVRAGRNMARMSADVERDAEHWRHLEAEARTVAANLNDPARVSTSFTQWNLTVASQVGLQ